MYRFTRHFHLLEAALIIKQLQSQTKKYTYNDICF